MARIFRKREETNENEIDLTPMLDVVFIMLIFFIVTASFIQEVGFDVVRPPPAPPNQQATQAKNAVFVISESNEIELNGLRVDPRAVRARIERILAENSEASVVVRAHPNSDSETYVTIADASYEVAPSLKVSLVIAE